MPTRRKRLLLPLLLPLFFPAAPAAGQSAPHTLLPGDEVQVVARGVRDARVRGTVVLYQGSTLDVREARTRSIVSIPVADIRMLARNVGMDRGRSAWFMARFGAFIGGAAGLVSGPLIATTHAPDDFTEVLLVSGLVGTVAGAGTGAILGAVFARDRWQRFRMPIVPTVEGGRTSLRVGVEASLR